MTPVVAATLDTKQCARRARDLSFARRVHVPFELSRARLEDWWATATGNGPVAIGRSRLLALLPGSDEHRLRIDVSLGRGSTLRAVPMELELDRWAGFGTGLVLQPWRDVRPTPRFFAEGHALLDELEAIIDPAFSS